MNGVTFGDRHDILKGYTRRNLDFLQVVVKTLESFEQQNRAYIGPKLTMIYKATLD
jgi:hypothetical protein